MVKESYVSFGTAKLLKEKGFNEYCNKSYSVNGTLYSNFPKDCILVPTLQMAMKWLREVHNLHIEVEAYPHEDGCFYWCYRIMHLCKNGRIFGYYKKLLKAGFDSYEEAVEAAIKACLENLI